MIVTIVVAHYEHLHRRLVCYIWLRLYQKANEYTNKEDNDWNSLLRYSGYNTKNEDLRNEDQQE